MQSRILNNLKERNDSTSSLSSLSISSENYHQIYDYFVSFFPYSEFFDLCVSSCLEIYAKDLERNLTEEYLHSICYIVLSLIYEDQTTFNELFDKEKFPVKNFESVVLKCVDNCKAVFYIPTTVTFLSYLTNRHPILSPLSVSISKICIAVLRNNRVLKYDKFTVALVACYYTFLLHDVDISLPYSFFEDFDTMEAMTDKFHNFLTESMSPEIEKLLGPELFLLMSRYSTFDVDISSKELKAKFGNGKGYAETGKCNTKYRITPENLLSKGNSISNGPISVYKYTSKNKTLAVKKFSTFSSWLFEVSILSSIMHPNVCSVLGYSYNIEEEFYTISMPFYPTTLYDTIVKNKESNATRRKWLLEIAEALKYLHENGILHGDLKSRNVLLDKRGNVKIADFGISLFYVTTKGVSRHPKYITFAYRPPELLFSKDDLVSFSFEVDIWSYGILLSEIFLGVIPTLGYGKEKTNILRYVTENYVDSYIDKLEQVDSDISTIARKCLQTNAKYRPSSSELVGYFSV